MAVPQRLTVQEARDSLGLVQDLARLADLTEPATTALLTAGGRRLRDVLALRASPVDVRLGGSVRVDRIAGLVRLSQALELEVVPKFLDPTDAGWQEDFFLLALFSRTGRVLPRDQIRAGHADRGDLATLVGRTLAQLFWEHRRRPLRVYRSRPTQDFSLDGDVEPLDLFVPDSDGFPQHVLQLRRDNEYNAVVAAAVIALMPEVRDSETRKQLLRVQQALAPQQRPGQVRARVVPARHRHWQPAYDLSVAVLQGFGVGFDADHLLAPGFLLTTWPTWQALIETVLRAGLSGFTVHAQRPYRLGERSALLPARAAPDPLKVTPDLVIADGRQVHLAVDAKYRTRAGVTPSVDAGDLYETLAFLRATGARDAVLLYPRPSSAGAAQPVGTATAFEVVTVDLHRITGMYVECRGISAAGGWHAFGTGVTAAVRAHLPVRGTSDRVAAPAEQAGVTANP
jgi:5-methylcytosine-specific restriction enzyme subunit McrC